MKEEESGGATMPSDSNPALGPSQGAEENPDLTLDVVSRAPEGTKLICRCFTKEGIEIKQENPSDSKEMHVEMKEEYCICNIRHADGSGGPGDVSLAMRELQDRTYGPSAQDQENPRTSRAAASSEGESRWPVGGFVVLVVVSIIVVAIYLLSHGWFLKK